MRNSLLSWPSDQPALRNFIKLFAVEDLFGSAENLTFRSGSGQSCLGPVNQTLPFLLGKTADDGNQYIPQHRYWTFAVEPRLSHGFILNVLAVQCVKEVQRLPRTHTGYTVKFPNQYLMFDFNGIMAKHFRRQLLRNMNRGKPRRAQLGRKAGGQDIYGYRTDDPGAYHIHQEEAEVVRLVYDLALSGRTMRQIQRDLADRGIASPRGRRWSRQRNWRHIT